jgi:hypothetical protein
LRGKATGVASVVAGGFENEASGNYATVPGGAESLAAGPYSFAAGRRAKVHHDGTFAWADSMDTDLESTSTNQFLIRASGGVGINTNHPAATLHVNGDLAANAVRAPGAGINTHTFAFVHRAAATNTVGNQTLLSNPLSDGDPNALVFITHNGTADTNSVTKYNITPVGVYYTGSRWAIFNEDGTTMGHGRAFNVLIIKP